MSGQPPPSENASGAQEDPQQHEIREAISSARALGSSDGTKEPTEAVDVNDLNYTANSDQHNSNSTDIEDPEFAAAANNLAMYLSSLESGEGVELAPENTHVSQSAPQEPLLDPQKDSDEPLSTSKDDTEPMFLEDYFEYNNLREMLEQAAAAVIEESKEDSGNNSSVEDSAKHSTAEIEDAARNTSENARNEDAPDSAMDELQDSINKLLGQHDTEMTDAFDSANIENASSIAEELVNSLTENPGEGQVMITESSVAEEINKVLAAAAAAAENATASSEPQEASLEIDRRTPSSESASESHLNQHPNLPLSPRLTHESTSPVTTLSDNSSSLISNAPDHHELNDRDLETRKLQQSATDNHQTNEKDVPEDFSKILLNALELALNGDNDESSEKMSTLQESRETSEAPESPGTSALSDNETPAETAGGKEEESEFDLDTIQELLMSAEHISTKDSEAIGSSKILDEKEKGDTIMVDVDRSGNHEEILAQLSSLLHPEDADESMGINENSNDVIDALTSALGNQEEEKGDEDESNQIDINLFVSAIQSALEEAQVESRLDEDDEEASEDQRSTFSKLEIQDALKSITDADGSLLLDLSSKSTNQRPVSSLSTDASNVDGSSVVEDDEENIRSTANLVEVLFQSGLLNTDNLSETAIPKSKSKATQRSTAISSAASRGKNIRAPRTTTSSQYNSTMSIAETLAYTRSHMNQKPKEAKIDPMVTRRELNRTALLKARQMSQSRSSSRAAPTYYVPPQSQSSLDKELSYRLYTPSSSSKPGSSSTTQRGQFHSTTETFNRGSQSSTGTRKRPPKTRFYYYTPPTPKSLQNGQERPGPSFAANAPRSQSDATSLQSGEQSSEQGEHNLLTALLLAKRAFGSQSEVSSEPAASQSMGAGKSTSDLVDAETMKAIQAALEAVGNTLVDEGKDKSTSTTATSLTSTSVVASTSETSPSTAQSSSSEKPVDSSLTSQGASTSTSSSTLPPLPPLPPPTYPEDTATRSSSATPSETTSSSHATYTSTTQIRRPGSRRKANNGSNVMTADERERVRIENRERKKRWRGQNMDRNRDNDLRGRVTRRATQIYGAANTPQKMKWIEAEFQSRKLKRLERGVIDSFSFTNFKGSKPTNPVQSVMPEGAQQRFGSTGPEGSASKNNTPDGSSEFINGFQATVSWSNNKSEEEDTRTTRTTQPSVRKPPGTTRAKPVSSGGTNPSFFASRGAKAPTPLPMGGIVTSFKLKTNRPAAQKKSHLFNVPKPVEPINLNNSSPSDNSLSLKRKRSVSSNSSSASSLSSIALYSAGLIPPHLLPPDVSPVPLPKPLPFNGPSSSKKPAIVKPSYSSSSSIDLTKSPSPATRPSILSTVQSVTERFQEANKSSSSEGSSSAQPPSAKASASPTPASASPRAATPVAEDKRVRAMGFPPILTGMTLRR